MSNGSTPRLDVVIFSKDRAPQLDLLLRSLATYWDGLERIRLTALVAASDIRFAQGYARLAERHRDRCILVPEQSFRADLLRLVDQAAPHIAFLVDDDVAIAPFTLDAPQVALWHQDEQVLCLSLRLGPGITHCYMQDRPSPPPTFLPGRRFAWQDAAGDWGYPMSLDGHLFRRSDLLPLLQQLDYHHPNSLESALAAHAPQRPYMMCLDRPRLVNIPANVVQPFPSRNAGGSARWLNEVFLDGQDLDLAAIVRDAHGRAVHQEIPLHLPPHPDPAPPSPPPPMPAAARSALDAHLAAGRRRIHLGCGSRYRDGWINVDLPVEGSVQQRQRQPDMFCDLLAVEAPPASLDHVYAAHVFEHFQRHIAVGLLCRWNTWLPRGGLVELEMPDVDACMREMVACDPLRRRELVRHLWGSHEATWATHHEGWMPETADAAMQACGYAIADIRCIGGQWPSFVITGRKQIAPSVDRAMGFLAPMHRDDGRLLRHWLSTIRGEVGNAC